MVYSLKLYAQYTGYQKLKQKQKPHFKISKVQIQIVDWYQ